MKRLGTKLIVSPNIQFLERVGFRIVFGLVFIVLVCFFSYGTNNNKSNTNYVYTASIFDTDIKADKITKPDETMHIQRNSDIITLSDLVDNLPAVREAQHMKKFRISVKKIVLEDISQSWTVTCNYVEIELLWKPIIREHQNITDFKNVVINSSYNASYRFNEKLIWNPDVYSNNALLDDDHNTGTLFIVVRKRFIPRLTTNNIFKYTLQSEITPNKLEKSSSFEFKLYGPDNKN